MQNPKINIFACGGVGMKSIGRFLNDKQSLSGSANVLFCDTSLSDCRQSGIDPSRHNVFIPPDIKENEGGGKVRTNKVNDIRDAVPGLMQERYTEDKYALNIIVTATGGGSGNVFAHFIAKYLMERNMQVVMIAVTSDESRRAISNTISAISGYEKLAESIGRPLTMLPIGYTRHSKDTKGFKTYDAVEKEIRSYVNNLIFLYSENADKIDLSDRQSFLCYYMAEDEPNGRINRMYIYRGPSDSIKINLDNIISVVSVYPENSEPNLTDVMCTYMVDGFSPALTDEVVHYVIAEHGISDISKALLSIDKSINESLSSRSKKEAFGFSKDKKADDDGFVV